MTSRRLGPIGRFFGRVFGVARAGETRRDPDATEEYPMPHFQGDLKLRVGVISVVGNYRDHNEDNYYVPGRMPVQFDAPPEKSSEMSASILEASNLFIVADGMGGQQAGEQASLMAIQLLPRSLARRLPLDANDAAAVQKAVRDAVGEVNHEIMGSAGVAPELANMGTTVVLALFRKDRVYVAGMGDSRAYRLRRGVLEQLTRDHSLADALSEAGTITPEEVPHHKFKNMLYLYLGCKDARDGPEEVRVLDVQVGDRFLLASDGLTGVVSDDVLAQLLGEGDDPQETARTMKDLALHNGSKDNVTSLVIHVV